MIPSSSTACITTKTMCLGEVRKGRRS